MDETYRRRERLAMIAVSVVSALLILAWGASTVARWAKTPSSAHAETPTTLPTNDIPLIEELRGEAHTGIETVKGQLSEFRQEWEQQKAFADFVRNRFPSTN